MTVAQTQRDERFYSLVGTWKNCYIVTLGNKKNYKKRLNELTTWDKPRVDNKIEHTAKITALQLLLR